MIRTYGDSGVLIDAYRGAASLASSAIAILSDVNREFVSSDFVKLEALPKPTYHNRAAEVAFYQAFFEAVQIWVPVTPQLVQRALAVASAHGLSAIDALHATAAEEAGAELVMSEKPSSPLFRLAPTQRMVSIRP